MNYKTSGIVIKRMNFGEADRILTIFTRRFGKIKAIAKGVRKIKSKLAGNLEPFMLLDLQLHEGKTFYIVTGSIIQKEFPLIHTDLKKISKAFYAGELIDKFMRENQKAPEIFQIFSDVLLAIEKDRSFLMRIFELRVIEASGFKPELYNCIHCKEKLKEGENFWDNIEGGVICSDCQGKNHHSKKISNTLIKIFRLIDQGQFETLQKLKLNSSVEREADEILSEYVQSILERELKSKRFMKLVE